MAGAASGGGLESCAVVPLTIVHRARQATEGYRSTRELQPGDQQALRLSLRVAWFTLIGLQSRI